MRQASPRATRPRLRAAALAVMVLPVLLSGAGTAAAGTSGGAGSGSVRVTSPTVAGGVEHGLRLKVRGRTPAATPLLATSTSSGYTPAQVRASLGLTGTGAGQTIAIVTAYDAPHAAQDLAVFSKAFGLPVPSLRKVDQKGGTRYPSVNAGWALETALDLQWAHAIAPDAALLLVEASSSALSNLLAAVSYAATQPGVTVISNSYGTTEFSKQSAQDYRCRLTTAVCVFASGDLGNPGTYPATSPHVLAVGGTSLDLDASGAVLSEVAWSGSGGGVSRYSPKPAYQSSVTTVTRRSSPDVSYGAGGTTGYAVYSSTPYDGQSGWFEMGGTSAGAPQWAGIVAAANQLRKAVGKGPLVATTATGATPLHTALYRSRDGLRDIVTGSNGTCGSVCTAVTGYDTVTGLGSPRPGLDRVLRDAT